MRFIFSVKQRELGKSAKHMAFFVLSLYEEALASLLTAEDLAGWQSWQSHVAHRCRGPSDYKAFLAVYKVLSWGWGINDPSQAPEGIL